MGSGDQDEGFVVAGSCAEAGAAGTGRADDQVEAAVLKAVEEVVGEAKGGADLEAGGDPVGQGGEDLVADEVGGAAQVQGGGSGVVEFGLQEGLQGVERVGDAAGEFVARRLPIGFL